MVANLFSFTCLACFLLLLSIHFQTTTAQFGVSKGTTEEDILDDTGIDDYDTDDFMSNVSDLELAEAFQMLAEMSPDEMQETMEELKSLMGDDPEAIAEIEAVMNELSQMSPEELAMTMEELMEEEADAYSIQETMDMLANADDDMWEEIIETKDILLEHIFTAGGFTEEEYQTFKESPEDWEKELRGIWDELRQEAQDEHASEGKDEL